MSLQKFTGELTDQIFDKHVKESTYYYYMVIFDSTIF